MDEREKYEKLINKLRNNQPVMEGKDEFTDSVMDGIRQGVSGNSGRKYLDFIFGWADKVWIRRSLSTISFLLVTVFLFQQFIIIDRIGDLESQVVGGTYDEFDNSPSRNENTRSVMRVMFEMGMAGDSIIVAEKDLIELIRSYRDLQRRYEELENTIIERKNLQGMPGDKELKNSQKTNLKLKT
jgi:hypothetical protein